MSGLTWRACHVNIYEVHANNRAPRLEVLGDHQPWAGCVALACLPQITQCFVNFFYTDLTVIHLRLAAIQAVLILSIGGIDHIDHIWGGATELQVIAGTSKLMSIDAWRTIKWSERYQNPCSTKRCTEIAEEFNVGRPKLSNPKNSSNERCIQDNSISGTVSRRRRWKKKKWPKYMYNIIMLQSSHVIICLMWCFIVVLKSSSSYSGSQKVCATSKYA